MTRLSEKRDVQDQLIHHLIAIGWRYLPPGDVAAARGNDEREPFLPAIARARLVALNASPGPHAGPGLVSEESADDVLRRLRRVPASLEGNEQFLRALRGQWTIYDPGEKRERNLALIDYDRPEANDFTFTQEFPFQDRDRRRMDVVLFVNGFPVAVIENKSPAIPAPELEAFHQVQHTYAERIPEFIKFVQLFATCDIRIHYGPTWNDSLNAFYRWKAQGAAGAPAVDYGLEPLSKTLFDRAHLLRMLRDYVVFFRADDQTSKYVLRPHQIRAVERIVARVTASLPSPPSSPHAPSPRPRGRPSPPSQPGRSGLIWHTQGSGKTLTMIVAAHVLRRLPGLANPTLLVVVDRRELETQMAQNLEAFGFPAVARAGSKRHLCDLLRSDYRGLIVTLIQKFDRAPKDLNRRDNVVVLVDEAHRTQEGDLATTMRAALPNAFYLGFTGTPVDRGAVGRGTFETFGRPDPGGYLDRYGIDESIADGTTVPLYYALAPSELRIDRQTLEEEFYRAVEEAGVASIEELDRLLERADKLKAVLKAPARVEAIAAHAAAHFQGNVAPRGFKAFLVAVDREACALFKEALDRHLPPECSQVVYTPYYKDRGLLRRHHLDQDAEKRVRKAFRDPASQPRMLIVTQKLLTGYDAPVLYAMYLDKPLKDHTLLQAIARVNRPHPDKESGLIVDYIGVLEDLQRALAFDVAEVGRALIDLQELKEQFVALMGQVQAHMAPIDLDGQETDRVARIIDRFFEPEEREAFVHDFKALQTAYEILSPDPFLREHMDRYALAAQVYRVVYAYFDPQAARRRLQHDLLRKTDALIREHVQVAYLIPPLCTYRIDRDIASVVAADEVSEQVKVINLYRSLVAHIEQQQSDQPYLASIGEEVEAIIAQLRQRQISARLALQRMQAQAGEAARAGEEGQASDLPGPTFALYWVLRGSGILEARARAQEVQQALDACPDWPYNEDAERQVRIALYKALLDDIGRDPARLKDAVEHLLRMHRTVNE